MSSVFNDNPAFWAFGFHTEESANKTLVYEARRNDHVYANISKFLSWFPVISIVSSVYEFYKISKLQATVKKHVAEGADPKKGQISLINTFIKANAARAIIQIFLAPLFFIIDMFVFIARVFSCCKSPDHSIRNPA